MSAANRIRNQIRVLADNAGLNYSYAGGSKHVEIRDPHTNRKLTFDITTRKGRARVELYAEKPEDLKAKTYKCAQGWTANLLVDPEDKEAPRNVLEWISQVSDETRPIIRKILAGQVYDLGAIRYEGKPFAWAIANVGIYSTKNIKDPEAKLEIEGIICVNPATSILNNAGIVIDLDAEEILFEGKPIDILNKEDILDAVRKAIREWSEEAAAR